MQRLDRHAFPQLVHDGQIDDKQDDERRDEQNNNERNRVDNAVGGIAVVGNGWVTCHQENIDERPGENGHHPDRR